MNEELLIYTTYDSFEADRIIAALKSCEIPAYKREHGAGQYLSIYMGANTTQSIDIIIPEQAEEKAVELLMDMGLIEEMKGDEHER